MSNWIFISVWNGQHGENWNGIEKWWRRENFKVWHVQIPSSPLKSTSEMSQNVSCDSRGEKTILKYTVVETKSFDTLLKSLSLFNKMNKILSWREDFWRWNISDDVFSFYVNVIQL